MDSDYDELIDSLPPGLRRQVIRALRRGQEPPEPTIDFPTVGPYEPLPPLAEPDLEAIQQEMREAFVEAGVGPPRSIAKMLTRLLRRGTVETPETGRGHRGPLN